MYVEPMPPKTLVHYHSQFTACFHVHCTHFCCDSDPCQSTSLTWFWSYQPSLPSHLGSDPSQPGFLCPCLPIVIIYVYRISTYFVWLFSLLLVLVVQSLSCVQIFATSWAMQPSRLLCPWDFPGKNTGMSCHFLLQRIFPTQGSNLCLLHWQADSLPLSHPGSPLFSYNHLELGQLLHIYWFSLPTACTLFS